MLITGQFRNIDDELITVNIVTENSTSTTKTIGQDGLFFSGDPIHIETSIKDMFEHVIRKSATINLVTSTYLGNLFFANNSRSTTVEILKGNTCLFSGFVDPNTYNQPWTSPLDEFEINCIDCLCTLEYYNYQETTIDTFNTNKRTASNVTFKSIIDDMFTDILNVNGHIYYDMSKGITSSTTQNVFAQLGVAETLFYGEDFSKMWTEKQVLEEMLRYLNLHIIQEGYDYYIFDWNTLKNGRTQWVNLATNTIITKSPTRVNLLSSMHSDNSTSISIDNVYNQVQVKDDINGQDTVIISPLENSSLTSLYTGKQLYMTEYISEGSGDRAYNAMVAMINGNATTYDKATQIDWYIQAMNNPNWKFYYDGQNVVDSLAESDGRQFINQWKLARYLKQNQCVPYIFKLGSVEKKAAQDDNSPISKIDMTPYLYISINGNENDTENSQSPNDTTIHSHEPIIEYVANNSGGVLSPADEDTINYLVFSGELLLQPIVYESSSNNAKRTNNYQDIKTNGLDKDEGSHAQVPRYSGSSLTQNNLVKSDNNDEGRYYTRKFYTQVYPSDEPINYLQDGTCGIQPWTADKSAHGYEFNHSAIGNNIDTFSKLPVLACELIIGNKRLIETNIDEFGNSTFEWVELGQEPTITYDGVSYPVTTFTLGVNPKIDDYIIGDEFKIQNTISYTMNIDAEGTAIAIRKSDALSGALIFRILGPVNSMWNDIVRIHPSFWRHTQWNSNWHFVLAHTENIIVKDLECKIYSNNAGYEVNQEKDLIYMSDETNDYINKKDGLTFKLITQLSSAEANEKGLSAGVNLNAVIDMTQSLPLTSLYNATTQETAKAEEHYVDQYYTEYHIPKILMNTALHNSNNLNIFNTYRSTTLNKNFFIQSMGLDVRMNKNNIILKEI